MSPTHLSLSRTTSSDHHRHHDHLRRSSSAAAGGVTRPRKLKESCDQCASTKVKCSREQPTCMRCYGRGLVCTYSTSRRRGKHKASPVKMTSSPEWKVQENHLQQQQQQQHSQFQYQQGMPLGDNPVRENWGLSTIGNNDAAVAAAAAGMPVNELGAFEPMSYASTFCAGGGLNNFPSSSNSRDHHAQFYRDDTPSGSDASSSDPSVYDDFSIVNSNNAGFSYFVPPSSIDMTPMDQLEMESYFANCTLPPLPQQGNTVFPGGVCMDGWLDVAPALPAQPSQMQTPYLQLTSQIQLQQQKQSQDCKSLALTTLLARHTSRPDCSSNISSSSSASSSSTTGTIPTETALSTVEKILTSTCSCAAHGSVALLVGQILADALSSYHHLARARAEASSGTAATTSASMSGVMMNSTSTSKFNHCRMQGNTSSNNNEDTPLDAEMQTLITKVQYVAGLIDRFCKLLNCTQMKSKGQGNGRKNWEGVCVALAREMKEELRETTRELLRGSLMCA